MGSNLHMKCTLVACHLPALMLLHLPLHFLYDFDLNLDATYCCTSKLTVDRKTLKAIWRDFELLQPVRTLFLFKSIWMRSQGSHGCQRIIFYFSKIKVLSFCANIAPESSDRPKQCFTVLPEPNRTSQLKFCFPNRNRTEPNM